MVFSSFFAIVTGMNVEWKTEKNNLVNYEDALTLMETRVAALRNDDAQELVWLLEHPHIFTAGTSAKDSDLLNNNIPVFKTGRGGEYTYHGPNQRIAYVMLDLKKRNACDVRLYVHNLEEWIIKTLAKFKIKGERRENRVGIWVVSPNGTENKIAAIGVRLRKWCTYHGIAINLAPDLSYYEGIVPCGIKEHGVTSFEKLGVDVSMDELDEALMQTWSEVF